jgi:hypothetical protein
MTDFNWKISETVVQDGFLKSLGGPFTWNEETQAWAAV